MNGNESPEAREAQQELNEELAQRSAMRLAQVGHLQGIADTQAAWARLINMAVLALFVAIVLGVTVVIDRVIL